ncbi:MAG: hypothetical protein AAF597_19430, partial [Bacteroidota bacterium]
GRGGPDVQRLARRFRAFAGPRIDGKPVIQNGLDRFGPEWLMEAAVGVDQFRERMLTAAQARHQLVELWNKALAGGHQLVEAIKPPTEQYYAKKDPLTLHYKESIDRHFEAGYRNLLLESKRATFVAVAAGASYFLWGWPFVALYPLLVVAAACGWYFLYNFRRKVRRVKELGIVERLPLPYRNELSLRKHITIPVGLGVVALLLSPVAGSAYFAALFGWLATYLWVRPDKAMNAAARQFEILADDQQRLERYGNALVSSLQEANLFHQATPEQLRLERDGDELVLYLSDAEHHDSHLFAAALAELMSPVDNPRYLLRLEPPADWSRGEYYLAVPGVFRTRELATTLAANLSTTTNHDFLPVYTREPSGRLHLLTARLQ